MVRKPARALTVLAPAASVAVAGTTAASAGGKGSSSTAATVRELRDGLKSRADAGDVPGARSTLNELQPLLGELAKGERYNVQAAARDTAATAEAQPTEAKEGVDDVATQVASRQALPPAAALLNAVAQRPLISLSSLVNDLLGGLPVPVG